MKERILTAIVAALIFLPIVYIGKFPFIILIYLMASVALFEMLRMKQIPTFSLAGIVSLLLLWVFLFPVEYDFTFVHIDMAVKGKVFLFLVLVLLTITVITNNRYSFDEIGFTILSVLYIGTGFYYLMETRFMGILFIFFSLFLIWATDSGAYFIGRAIGKRKLAPSISPNKTVEGSIGGIFFALIVALLFYYLSDISNGIDFARFIIFSIILSVFGQLGDLVESALKRHYGVKDSGWILPGHGGILDRTDSWLFVMPLFQFLFNL
ncbi:phosphatidate cytidylyltransferase [Fervidibacillus halotolerans]|uniref:Phosphatidate cytidylyltransferase n=1 Tax=Fervidibacillus halotolerans TaxID=2980027 RepID=A0A9E8M128_9BACI|nr:phosphatidate cytidylyltransferase [Fervidibacillus halotolerans]WAA13573.1 phosphatidate cytidylyltransferase [Fervidibacillus halotolerans]